MIISFKIRNRSIITACLYIYSNKIVVRQSKLCTNERDAITMTWHSYPKDVDYVLLIVSSIFATNKQKISKLFKHF